MNYKVQYSNHVLKKLKKMDKQQAKMIVSWIEKNLENTNNPRQYGKAMRGNFSEYWRYRVGQYRIIANIVDDKVRIELVNIGHRKNIYD